jgi:hypothetical protein
MGLLARTTGFGVSWWLVLAVVALGIAYVLFDAWRRRSRRQWGSAGEFAGLVAEQDAVDERGDDNVVFDMPDNVYDPVSGDVLGSLTQGGAG